MKQLQKICKMRQCFSQENKTTNQNFTYIVFVQQFAYPKSKCDWVKTVFIQQQKSLYVHSIYLYFSPGTNFNIVFYKNLCSVSIIALIVLVYFYQHGSYIVNALDHYFHSDMDNGIVSINTGFGKGMGCSRCGHSTNEYCWLTPDQKLFT